MKVLLVNPRAKFNARAVAIPLGLIAIASYLQAKGHTIKLLDRSVHEYDVIRETEIFKPDVVGFSVIGHKSLPDAVTFSKKLNKIGINVAWGGPFAACMAENFLQNGYAEYIFTGEGELAWAEFLEALDGKRKMEEIYGLAYLDKGAYHFLGQHPLADLAEFPQMNFSLVNPSDYFQKSFGCERMLHICSAKGCPNHCTFCYNQSFNLSCYRKRPLNQVMNEIEFLVKNFSMDGIYFTDELWANTREEMHEYCSTFIDSGLNFVWGCQTTIGRFTKADYKLMYEAGCRWIFFGIESGSEMLLKKLGKNINLDEVEEDISNCVDCSIIPIAAFMIGIPMETEDDLKATVRLANRMPSSYYSVNFFYPVPGSVLFNNLIRDNKITLPKNGMALFNERPVEKIKKNISSVKPLDLNVIRACYMWRSFVGSGVQIHEKQSKLFFAKKTVAEALKSTLHHGAVNFFVQSLYSGMEFLNTVFYAFCFPKIRKKYGLDK